MYFENVKGEMYYNSVIGCVCVCVWVSIRMRMSWLLVTAASAGFVMRAREYFEE